MLNINVVFYLVPHLNLEFGTLNFKFGIVNLPLVFKVNRLYHLNAGLLSQKTYLCFDAFQENLSGFFYFNEHHTLLFATTEEPREYRLKSAKGF